MARKGTVYVVDDDQVIRRLMESLLEESNIPIETFSSAEEFMEVYSPDNPGCLLLDISMPGMSGLELQNVLASRGNKTPIIFLSGAAEVRMAVEALKSGALDFLEKPIQRTKMLEVVRKAIEMDLQFRIQGLQKSQVELRIMLLTPREREVMAWMIEGKSNKAIARILDISSRTVEIHRKKVLDKMQADSAIDLARAHMQVER